ncbi:MAG: hypothetical protein GY797_00210, partial [Deltaproteobacteria bacterium]|nr:hypothetical protein [Deltaproteobacteria bacterium]
MKIKTRILVSTLVMMFLAVLITIIFVLNILNQGVEHQTEALLENLHAQSSQRIRAGNSILQKLFTNHIQKFRNKTANLCSIEILREEINNGLWKAVSGHLETISKTAGFDFIMMFSPKGRLQTSWPDKVHAKYPEMHFKELALFKSFKKYVDDENFVDVPIVSSLEIWNRDLLKEYQIDSKEDTDIILLTAGIISNEYLDEPIAYVFAGIKRSQLFAPFDDFSRATGQLSLLVNGKTPLVWAGFSGEKNDIKKSLVSLGFDQIKNSMSDNSEVEFKHGGEGYHIYSVRINDFSDLSATTVKADSATALIITGESTRLVFNASDKIKQLGDKTKGTVLKSSLLIVFIVLILAAVV